MAVHETTNGGDGYLRLRFCPGAVKTLFKGLFAGLFRPNSKVLFYSAIVTISILYVVLWVMVGPLFKMDDEFFWNYGYLRAFDLRIENLFRTGVDYSPRVQALLFYPIYWLQIKIPISDAAGIILHNIYENFLAMKYLAIVYAGIVIFTCGWLFYRITHHLWISLIAVCFFATSPDVAIWAPRLDSRIICLIPFFMGLHVLFGSWCRKVSMARSLWAGVLLGCSFIEQYSATYFTVIFLPIFFVAWLMAAPRHWPRIVASGLVLALGLGIPLGVVQAIGVVLHQTDPNVVLPLDSYISQFSRHQNHGPLSVDMVYQRLLSWQSMVLNSGGAVLVCFALSGAALMLVGRDRIKTGPCWKRQSLVVAAVVGGPLFFLASSSLIFLRQTVGFQPFYCLFAAVVIWAVASRVKPIFIQVAAGLGLMLWAGSHQIATTAEIFGGHAATTQALRWLDDQQTRAAAPARPVYWAQGSSFRGGDLLHSWSDITRLEPESFVLFDGANLSGASQIGDESPGGALLREIQPLWTRAHLDRSALTDAESLISPARYEVTSLKIYGGHDLLSHIPDLHVARVSYRSGESGPFMPLSPEAATDLFTRNGIRPGAADQPLAMEIAFDHPYPLASLHFQDFAYVHTSGFTVELTVDGRTVRLDGSDVKQNHWAPIQGATDAKWAEHNVSAVTLIVSAQDSVMEHFVTRKGIKELSFPPYRVADVGGVAVPRLVGAAAPVDVVRIECSSFQGLGEGIKPFDQGVTPDLEFAWMAKAAPHPLFEFEFSREVPLSRLTVVDAVNRRLDGFDLFGWVQGRWVLLASPRDQKENSEIFATFPRQGLKAIRLTNFSVALPQSPGATVAIDEIVIPEQKILVKRPVGNCQRR